MHPEGMHGMGFRKICNFGDGLGCPSSSAAELRRSKASIGVCYTGIYNGTGTSHVALVADGLLSALTQRGEGAKRLASTGTARNSLRGPTYLRGGGGEGRILRMANCERCSEEKSKSEKERR